MDDIWKYLIGVVAGGLIVGIVFTINPTDTTCQPEKIYLDKCEYETELEEQNDYLQESRNNCWRDIDDCNEELKYCQKYSCYRGEMKDG